MDKPMFFKWAKPITEFDAHTTYDCIRAISLRKPANDEELERILHEFGFTLTTWYADFDPTDMRTKIVCL